MKFRCRGFWILLVVGAIPLVGIAEEPEREVFATPTASPTILESSPAFADGLPRFISLRSDEGPRDDEGVAGVPSNNDLTGGEATRGEDVASDETVCVPVASIPVFPFGYNLRQSDLSWIVGSGDELGIFSMDWLPTLSPGEKSGLVAGASFHFLSGPSRTDLPPRLFDFQIGWQQRNWTSDTFGYDLSLRVGAFSDFEGSARKGVRFPGHAVGYYRWSPKLDWVLGIESLDRDDISVLPVLGVIITPRDDLRLELVFPRPRVEVRVNPTHSLYLAGELGGGTWAIERTSRTNDVVTYRDLRLLLGISGSDDDGNQSGIELGYVFGRDLSYRSGLGDYQPDDTLLIRLTNRY